MDPVYNNIFTFNCHVSTIDTWFYLDFHALDTFQDYKIVFLYNVTQIEFILSSISVRLSSNIGEMMLCFSYSFCFCLFHYLLMFMKIFFLKFPLKLQC